MKQSFDEIVENSLRIWFGNFDKMDDDAKDTYRVPMKYIVDYVLSQADGGEAIDAAFAAALAGYQE